MHHPSQAQSACRPPIKLADEPAAPPSDARTEPSSTELAVWLAPARSADESLELNRRLIEHYSEPGDLVLSDNAKIAAAARQLKRRCDHLNPPTESSPGAAVIPLPLKRRPALALAELTGADTRETAELAETAAASLAPEGLLALTLTAEPTTGRAPRLGRIVDTCRGAGLRYWQHLIVIDGAANLPGDAPAAARRGGSATTRSRRVHIDLLVFRRASEAATAAAATAREAVAA